MVEGVEHIVTNGIFLHMNPLEKHALKAVEDSDIVVTKIVCKRRLCIVHFKEFKLDEKILRAIEQLGYTEPTEVQQKVIPVVLENRMY